MLELARRFLDENISQTEIVQISFDLQISIAKNKRTKGGSGDRFSELSDSLVEILGELLARNDPNSLPIISVIPSILHQIDTPDQNSIQTAIQLDADFEQLYALLHSVAELSLSNECSACIINRIGQLLTSDDRTASSLLNLSMFLYETHRGKQWATLVRNVFNAVPKAEMANCSLHIKSRRSCIRELSSSICLCIGHSDALLPADLFLLLVLASCGSLSISKTLKDLTKKERLRECSLKDCPVGVINSVDLIDSFCCLCSSTKAANQIDDISRLIVEAFVESGNAEILTFALFNEDENEMLLKASIAAVVRAAQECPHILADKLELYSLLSITSKSVMEELIRPCVRMVGDVPLKLLDQMIILLKKMITRPAETRLAVDCFRELLSSVTDEHVQAEVVEFLKGQIGNPYMESLIFGCLARARLCDSVKYDLRRCFRDLEVSFSDLICVDEAGLIQISSFPAARVELLLSLGRDPEEFNELVDFALTFNTGTDPLHLALMADALVLLSMHNPKAMDIFCEYFRAIEVLSGDKERKMIAEWCSLSIDRVVLQQMLLRRISPNILNDYVMIRQFVSDDYIDSRIMRVFIELFHAPPPARLSLHTPLCTVLEDDAERIFGEDYIRFREELTVLISKNAKVGDVGVEACVDSMIYESLNHEVTSRHCDAYLTIFDRAFEVSEIASEKLFSVLTTLGIGDANILSRIILLTLNKSPEADAFTIANALFSCAFEDDNTVLLTNDLLKNKTAVTICTWLCKYIPRATEMSDEIIDITLRFISLEKPAKAVAKSVMKVISKISSCAANMEFPRLREFRRSCEQWFKQFRQVVGVRECGMCSARLQVLANRDKEEVSAAPIQRFFKRKWRSRIKWIDDGLKEESDSDDNFADLEDFLVEESPSDHGEEEEVYSY